MLSGAAAAEMFNAVLGKTLDILLVSCPLAGDAEFNSRFLKMETQTFSSATH